MRVSGLDPILNLEVWLIELFYLHGYPARKVVGITLLVDFLQLLTLLLLLFDINAVDPIQFLEGIKSLYFLEWYDSPWLHVSDWGRRRRRELLLKSVLLSTFDGSQLLYRLHSADRL